MKRNLLYIMNQSVPRCKHSTTVIKTSQWPIQQRPLSVLRSVQNTQRKESTM